MINNLLSKEEINEFSFECLVEMIRVKLNFQVRNLFNKDKTFSLLI